MNACPHFWTRFLSAFFLAVLLCIPAFLPIRISHNIGFIPLAAASGGLVALAAKSPVPLFPFKGLRCFLLYIGERSFGLYLVHRFIGGVYQDLYARHPEWLSRLEIWRLSSENVRLGLHIFTLLAIVELLYWIIEKPCMKNGRRLSDTILASQTVPVESDSLVKNL